MPEDRDVQSVLAVVRELRSEFNARVDELEARLQGPHCSVCGHGDFKEGPKGRRSKNGTLPACEKCGSLERHRVVRAVWNAFVGEQFRHMKALQFSSDPSVDKKWFEFLEVSIYKKRNSLDLEKIDRRSESYHAVICNHVLEHMKDDRQAFREIMRILKRGGLFQFAVPNPHVLAITDDWGYPDPDRHSHYCLYGKDLVHRFGEVVPNVRFLRIAGADDATGVTYLVYFVSLDDNRLDSIQRRVGTVFLDRDAVNYRRCTMVPSHRLAIPRPDPGASSIDVLGGGAATPVVLSSALPTLDGRWWLPPSRPMLGAGPGGCQRDDPLATWHRLAPAILPLDSVGSQGAPRRRARGLSAGNRAA